ncbi:uncharacterized protein SOCE836_073530 [Sorangium cellulosum]|uniref:Uncharacterized protein n=1 Tax=Sorangium cellulosum TaxID=56 RepID=A0A4P2QXB6_SORCE|nr:uncharacterized protein SOCE836_073530 [Sorangium cellulosum]
MPSANASDAAGGAAAITDATPTAACPPDAASPGEAAGAAVRSVEILVSWGTTVLFVQHLAPPRAFDVGERRDDGRPCDLFLPERVLGARRAPLLDVDPAGRVRFVLLGAATGTLTLGGAPLSAADARARHAGATRPDLPGAVLVPLPPPAAPPPAPRRSWRPRRPPSSARRRSSPGRSGSAPPAPRPRPRAPAPPSARSSPRSPPPPASTSSPPPRRTPTAPRSPAARSPPTTPAAPRPRPASPTASPGTYRAAAPRGTAGPAAHARSTAAPASSPGATRPPLPGTRPRPTSPPAEAEADLGRRGRRRSRPGSKGSRRPHLRCPPR